MGAPRSAAATTAVARLDHDTRRCLRPAACPYARPAGAAPAHLVARALLRLFPGDPLLALDLIDDAEAASR